MKPFTAILLVAVVSLASAETLAADLAGYWKHDEQATWIEILSDGAGATGIVRRNDAKPDSVGRTLLKDVVGAENDPAAWRGQIYAAPLGEFKDAEIKLAEPDHMQIKVNVGFFSRTVNWTRAAGLPGE